MYRLLIVDDEKDICENIKYLLDWSMYNITSILTATSYAEAVSKAVDFQPHIALLDINLGDHWGYELAEHLRSMGMQTVFCMISGYDDFNYVHKSMQATARDYLLKPIHVAELRAFIERTIVRTSLKAWAALTCIPPTIVRTMCTTSLPLTIFRKPSPPGLPLWWAGTTGAATGR